MTKKVYRWDCTCKNNNWSRHIKCILKDIDKAELWNRGGSQVRVKEFIGYAEEKLVYLFSLKWSKDLESQIKLQK